MDKCNQYLVLFQAEYNPDFSLSDTKIPAIFTFQRFQIQCGIFDFENLSDTLNNQFVQFILGNNFSVLG